MPFVLVTRATRRGCSPAEPAGELPGSVASMVEASDSSPYVDLILGFYRKGFARSRIAGKALYHGRLLEMVALVLYQHRPLVIYQHRR
jgi:hypothetical protein